VTAACRGCCGALASGQCCLMAEVLLEVKAMVMYCLQQGSSSGTPLLPTSGRSL